jgi:hypothetical protein
MGQVVSKIVDAVESVPGVSHAVALVAKVIGEDDVAKEYWDKGNQAASAMLNSIPVVGHVKGAIHYLCDDPEGAQEALLAATRTTVVLVAGAGAFLAAGACGFLAPGAYGCLVAGPIGAFVGGAAAGAAWDAAAFYFTYEETKHGVVKILYTLENDPTNVLAFFEGALEIAADGMTGYTGGKLAERIVKSSEISTKYNYREIRREIVPDDQKLTKTLQDGSVKTIKGTEVYAEAKDLNTGKVYGGSNKNVRSAINDPIPITGNEFLTENKYKPSTCAEPQALDKLYKENPNVDFSQVRVNTIEVKTGGDVYPKPRCVKCQEYDIGTVNTDGKMVNIEKLEKKIREEGC